MRPTGTYEMTRISWISSIRIVTVCFLVGAIVGIGHAAFAHTECNAVTDITSPPTYYFGDDHNNFGPTCQGGSGYDSFWGYGGNDVLRGGGGKDRLRGASQADDLHDDGSGGDDDDMCDGNGFDYIYMGDGDGRDDFFFTGTSPIGENGYTVVNEDFSLGDDVTNSNGNCPF